LGGGRSTFLSQQVHHLLACSFVSLPVENRGGERRGRPFIMSVVNSIHMHVFRLPRLPVEDTHARTHTHTLLARLCSANMDRHLSVRSCGTSTPHPCCPPPCIPAGFASHPHPCSRLSRSFGRLRALFGLGEGVHEPPNVGPSPSNPV